MRLTKKQKNFYQRYNANYNKKREMEYLMHEAQREERNAKTDKALENWSFLELIARWRFMKLKYYTEEILRYFSEERLEQN